MVFFKSLENKCRRRDRKATERAILLAASKLFAEKGFEGTRTLEIAKLAGANEALITRYFGGKEGLLAAIIKNEEALETVLEHKRASGADRFERFPTYSETGSFQKGMRAFFELCVKAMEVKEEFMKIGASRTLVDPEMAEAIKRNFLEKQLPLVVEGLRTYPELKNQSQAELEALGILIMTANFMINFQNRRIYKMDPAQVDRSLEIFIEGMCARYVRS